MLQRCTKPLHHHHQAAWGLNEPKHKEQGASPPMLPMLQPLIATPALAPGGLLLRSDGGSSASA